MLFLLKTRWIQVDKPGIMKKLSILRQIIYNCNHKEEKPRWDHFQDLVEKVYTYEYAIADKNNRILMHLKIWGK